jgi:hypothetical protein
VKAGIAGYSVLNAVVLETIYWVSVTKVMPQNLILMKFLKCLSCVLCTVIWTYVTVVLAVLIKDGLKCIKCKKF